MADSVCCSGVFGTVRDTEYDVLKRHFIMTRVGGGCTIYLHETAPTLRKDKKHGRYTCIVACQPDIRCSVSVNDTALC